MGLFLWAFHQSPTSPLGIYYFCNLKNLNVLKATTESLARWAESCRHPWHTPSLRAPQPRHHLGSVRPRGRALTLVGFSPVGARVRSGVHAGVAGAKPRGPSGGGPARGAGPRAHLPGAAGLAASARTDVPPPRSRLAVCLRGDEDGGGGDGVARAAEDGQPVSAETGSTPGGGERQARPCSLGGGSCGPTSIGIDLSFLPRPSPCLPPAFPSEAMEDEERQKKLEAGKAKVREPEAVGPAVGGGGWKGVGEGLANGDRSSPVPCPGGRGCRT